MNHEQQIHHIIPTEPKEKQTGIYIHIPFCVRKCVYCDFLSGPADEQVQRDYVKALCREIALTAKQQVGQSTEQLTEQLKGQTTDQKQRIQTVFFGGGTPSAIDAELIAETMRTVRAYYELAEDAEISIECNPGTLTREKAECYRMAGINRISFGLQSANDTELKMLGRIHTFAEFKESMQIAREAGFENINVDLMSALPGQTIETYQKTLDLVLAEKPEHISAYSLIVEEETPLAEHLSSFPALPDEDTEREMYYLTVRVLAEHGFEHYEISNFALPGYECKHNLSYWERKNYLGFGIGAASLFREHRYSNLTDLQQYIGFESLSELRCDKQTLSVEEQMEEFMFLGLRKIQGINMDEFSYEFTMNIEKIYGEVIERNLKEGMLEKTGRYLRLTGRGIDVSNVVMSEFLLT